MCGDAVSHRFAVTIKTKKKKNQHLDVESSDVSVKQMQGVEFRWDFLHYLYFLQACKGEACSAGCQLASACESAHSAVLFPDVDIHHSVAVSSQLLSASAHSCHRTSAAATHKHTRQLNNNKKKSPPPPPIFSHSAGNCTMVVKHKFLRKVQKKGLVSVTAQAAWEREASALGSQSSCSFRRWRCSADTCFSR